MRDRLPFLTKPEAIQSINQSNQSNQTNKSIKLFLRSCRLITCQLYYTLPAEVKGTTTTKDKWRSQLSITHPDIIIVSKKKLAERGSTKKILIFLKIFKLHQQPDSKYYLKIFKGNLKSNTHTFNLSVSQTHEVFK